MVRRKLVGACLSSMWLAAACATTVEAPASPPEAPVTESLLPTIDTTPVEADGLVPPTPSTLPRPPPLPPLPKAFIEHEGCVGRVALRRSSPVLFEGDVVGGLREIELDVLGPPGLVVALEDAGTPTPPWTDVELMPKVALRLPAGPARDAASGFSGALFDLGGLAVAGFANLMTLPISVPLGLLTNSDELFFFDAPSFKDGMFDDVVLDEKAWQAEVARRAAPHTAVLATEAERQKRFVAFRDEQAAVAVAVGCTVDDTGTCRLQTAWPTSSLSARFSGPTCPAVPLIADDDGKPVPAFTADEYYARGASLPSLPTAPSPTMLSVPIDPDERRGHGARTTRAAWAVASTQLEDPLADFARAKHRGTHGQPLREATLVCRLTARAGLDADGSAPDLVIRLAWGFDQDVVGTTFDEESASTRTFGVDQATLVPGELVKISVVDVDAFVDDWVGMALVTFDGTLPLRFSSSGFSAECRASALE